MASTYLPLQLVHAHLPAPPSIPLAIPELRIPTDRPFPESTQSYSEPLHPDHAVSAVHHHSTGTLARVIRNGYVLELRTLNPLVAKDRRRDGSGSETVRIFFPDRLLPLTDGCLVLSHRENKLFILVVTESTVVYRLNFPLGGFRTGKADRLSYSTKSEDWCEEYEVPDEVVGACGEVGSWIVLDDATVVLGGDDGGIVRLVRSGGKSSVYWTAAHYRPSAGFRLPSLFSRSQLDEQVVSFAKFTGDQSGTLVYALSRGHRLRIWNIDTGTCVKTVDVRPTTSTEMVLQSDTTPPRSSSSSSSASTDGATQIKVLRHPSSTTRYSHLVIAFFGSPLSSTSAGSFVVYRVSTGNGAVDLIQAGARPCSSSSAGSSLRGFEVLPPYIRDGMNTGWRLQVVWDNKGSPHVDTVVMDDIFQFTTYLDHPSSFLLTDWQSAIAQSDLERYDAAYFDNLLGPECPDATDPENNSDIVVTFIDHLFYPGRFSTLNLSTALEEYIQSLPRQRSAHFVSAANGLPTLQRRFAAIVGCHLKVESDASTGAPIVEVYRKELKLEWLGIWARVRDLDKQGRWPVSIAVSQDQMLVLTREGVSTPVVQDVTGVIARFAHSPEESADFRALPEGALRHLYPTLAAPKARSGSIALSSAGDYITSVLSRNAADEGEVNALEDVAVGLKSMFADGIQQPIEILAGEIWDDSVEPYLSDGDRTAVRRLLSECLDVRRAIREGLSNLTSQFSTETAHTATVLSGFGNALIASTVAAIIAHRYVAARNLLFIALFHLSETPDIMQEDDDHEDLLELLYRCFSIYHRYSVLKWVSEQTSEELNERAKLKKSTKRKAPGGDDVLSEGLGSLQVEDDEGAHDGYDFSYSLLHTLLDGHRRQAVPPPTVDMVYTAALGYLQSANNVTDGTFEVDPCLADMRFAYSILANGLPLLAGRFADLYPLSAGMAYIRGRAALEAGLVGEAVRSFEQAAVGCKDGSIAKLLPSCAGTSEFYRHVATLFAEHSHDAPVAHFGQLALRALPADAQPPKPLWTTVFLANIGLGQYEDAYAILTKTPYLDLQRDFLGQLISVMCEANEVGRLNQLSFIGLQKEVENLLSYKARNSDPLRFPNYYKVLYSWYISRGDYRSAGDIMYQQGRRFADSTTSKMSAFEMTAMQARSYLTAINTLTLVEKRNAWISVPGPPPRAPRGSKRRRISSHVPEEEFSKDKRPINIITLADIEAEYSLVLTKLRLSSHIQDLNEHGISLSPNEAVGLLVQRNMFDLALSAASTMEVDMTDIFVSIATRCVELSRVSDIRGDSSSATWLHTSPLTSRLRGSPSALALRYLQTALTQHDSTKTHFAYREAVRDKLFELNRDKSTGWQMPAWLVEWEMERDPEGWISRALKWGWVEEAVDWSSELLRRAVPPELLPKKPDVANASYNLFDRVIAGAGEGDEKDDKKVQGKVKALREAIGQRLGGLKKLEGR